MRFLSKLWGNITWKLHAAIHDHLIAYCPDGTWICIRGSCGSGWQSPYFKEALKKEMDTRYINPEVIRNEK